MSNFESTGYHEYFGYRCGIQPEKMSLRVEFQESITDDKNRLKEKEMSNFEAKFDAFIDAMGFDVEEILICSEEWPTHVERKEYKFTKREPPIHVETAGEKFLAERERMRFNR